MSKHEQQGPIVWDMPKVKRWVVDEGMNPRSGDAIDVYTLQRMEGDGLLQLDTVRSGGSAPRLIVTITALGEFEADRLEALEAAAMAKRAHGAGGEIHEGNAGALDGR